MNGLLQYLINVKQLEKIAALENNWNGYGANKFSSELIQTAKTILSTLTIQPQILPTANDSIQFEYRKNTGEYLEFELFESGKLKKFYRSSNAAGQTEFIPLQKMDEEVRRFYSER